MTKRQRGRDVRVRNGVRFGTKIESVIDISQPCGGGNAICQSGGDVSVSLIWVFPSRAIEGRTAGEAFLTELRSFSFYGL